MEDPHGEDADVTDTRLLDRRPGDLLARDVRVDPILAVLTSDVALAAVPSAARFS